MSLAVRILHERLPRFLSALRILAVAEEPIGFVRMFPGDISNAEKEWRRKIFIRMTTAGLIRRASEGREVLFEPTSEEARAKLASFTKEDALEFIFPSSRPAGEDEFVIPSDDDRGSGSDVEGEGGGDEPSGEMSDGTKREVESEPDVALLLAERLGHLTTALIAVREGQDALAGELSELKGAVPLIADAIVDLRKRLEVVEKDVRNDLATYSNELGESGDVLLEMSTLMGTKYREQTEQVAKALGEQTDQIQKGLEEQSANIADALEVQTKLIVRTVNEQTEEIHKTVGRFVDVVNAYYDRADGKAKEVRSRTMSLPLVMAASEKAGGSR